MAQFSSVQFNSVTQSCWTLCYPMDCRTPDFPVHHQLPELTQTYIHQIGDVIQPSHPLSSNHLILCHPLLLPLSIFPTIRVFSNESVLPIRWPKYCKFNSTSALPVNIQDWSPLGWTGWISLQSKGLSRVFSNTKVRKHQSFSAQLSLQSNSHIHTWLPEKPYLWLDGPLLAKRCLCFLIRYLSLL